MITSVSGSVNVVVTCDVSITELSNIDDASSAETECRCSIYES